MSRWNDGSYWAMKESSETSHKKMLRFMNRYKVLLYIMYSYIQLIITIFIRVFSVNLSSHFFMSLFQEVVVYYQQRVSVSAIYSLYLTRMQVKV